MNYNTTVVKYAPVNTLSESVNLGISRYMPKDIFKIRT
jgi:hypothetical protein